MRIEARRRVALWLLLGAGYAVCALYAASMGDSIDAMRVDEYVHFSQIEFFRHGDFHTISDSLTMLPGYHLLVASLLRVLQLDSFVAARLISSLAGLFAVIGFHRLRRDTLGQDDFLATAQFAVLPILVPFVFMVQTDVLSLALVLWSAWAAGRQRHWLAGLFLFAAICVRQNNVLWLILFVAPPLQTAWRRRSTEAFVGAIWLLMPYALNGAAFVAYWIWNGSVVLSRPETAIHPDFSLHSGNLFYLMCVAALLFVFSCVGSWRDFLAELPRTPVLALLPLGLALLYLCTFKVDHPFNLLQPPDLRDWLLVRTQQSAWWYYAFGAVAVFGGVGMLRQRLLDRDAVVFWLVVGLFVSLSWLIEQRYYLIPYALFMAWRAPQRNSIAYATLALWTPLAVLFFWGMMSGQLYL